MGGDSRFRGVVLLRTSGGTAGRADAGSGDVGDLRDYHWSVARDGRECAGLLGSGVDGRSKESRSAVDVSPPTAVDASHPGAVACSLGTLTFVLQGAHTHRRPLHFGPA
jgi:hypothetical protein